MMFVRNFHMHILYGNERLLFIYLFISIVHTPGEYLISRQTIGSKCISSNIMQIGAAYSIELKSFSSCGDLTFCLDDYDFNLMAYNILI